MEKTKYKPFDLKAAKNGVRVMAIEKNLGGDCKIHKARIICFDRDYTQTGQKCLVVLIPNDVGVEIIHTFFENGDSSLGAMLFLVHPTELKSGWVNVYTRYLGIRAVYKSEEEARLNGGEYVTCQREIFWYE